MAQADYETQSELKAFNLTLEEALIFFELNDVMIEVIGEYLRFIQF